MFYNLSNGEIHWIQQLLFIFVNLLHLNASLLWPSYLYQSSQILLWLLRLFQSLKNCPPLRRLNWNSDCHQFCMSLNLFIIMIELRNQLLQFIFHCNVIFKMLNPLKLFDLGLYVFGWFSFALNQRWYFLNTVVNEFSSLFWSLHKLFYFLCELLVSLWLSLCNHDFSVKGL